MFTRCGDGWAKIWDVVVGTVKYLSRLSNVGRCNCNDFDRFIVFMINA